MIIKTISYINFMPQRNQRDPCRWIERSQEVAPSPQVLLHLKRLNCLIIWSYCRFFCWLSYTYLDGQRWITPLDFIYVRAVCSRFLFALSVIVEIFTVPMAVQSCLAKRDLNEPENGMRVPRKARKIERSEICDIASIAKKRRITLPPK